MTLRPGIRAVFFDVGGPIYDDENFVVAVLRALDEMRADQGAAPVDRDVFREIYRLVRERQGGSLRTELAARLLGGPGLRQELHERTRAYWVHPQGSMYPDVRPLLEKLHEKVTVGVLANQEAAVVDAMRRDGLGDLVDVWGVSALVGFEKPSPQLFEWALSRACTTARYAVHVGNRLDTDVRPAKALGLGTVWVTRGEAPDHPTADQLDEPDLAVPDLSSLAGALLPLVGQSA